MKFFPLSYVARHFVIEIICDTDTEIISDWNVPCAVKCQTVHFRLQLEKKKHKNKQTKTFQNTSVVKSYSLDVKYCPELTPDTNTIA